MRRAKSLRLPRQIVTKHVSRHGCHLQSALPQLKKIEASKDVT